MKSLLALISLLLLAGCDYDTPLTEQPTRQIDPALVGSWFSLANGDPLEIYRLSASEYLVVMDGRHAYVATHSDLGGINFVSCRSLTQDDKSYGKYSYRAFKLEGDQLTLWNLNDNLGKMEKLTGAQRRAKIEAGAKAGTALDPSEKSIAHYRRKQ